MKYLELLAPAKNAEQGKAAIAHGADAVYIGAPQFGARVAAGNTLADIEELIRYAHLFGAKVYITVNTLLFDEEIAPANRLIHQLYQMGADALIVQDLGLLETGLPPIALHASTQTHNYDPQRIEFLHKAGFQRIILARETSLEQMRAIHERCEVELEAFIQGALCVCFSGQCYMSQYLSQRSGNRGCCGQPCRSTYDLYNESKKLLRREEHLLSLKDFSAAQHIESMVDAGITSFKIEGRLKDISYVKNVTAFYRQLLDNMMAGRSDLHASSSGYCRFYFTPDLERTFNRGFTDYFLVQRQPMASLSTQKSIGKPVGTVCKVNHNSLVLNSRETFSAGDGLCYFTPEGTLQGFLVNHVNGLTLTPNHMPDIAEGTPLWRNNDYAFEKQLQGKTSDRKIPVDIHLVETPDGLSLTLRDDDGCQATATLLCEKNPAQQPDKAREQMARQLTKLGDTPFQARDLRTDLTQPLFLPASFLNDLRRNASAQLIQQRQQHFRPQEHPFQPNSIPYPEASVDYRANIINEKSQAFYQRHGASVLEPGLERSHDYLGKSLMTTKYCLRYELGQCKLHKNNSTVHPDYAGDLYLRNNKQYFRLDFDCRRCEMHIVALTPPPDEAQDNLQTK